MSVRTTEEPARGRQAAKRRSLAKAAWRVFLERGLAGTTVRAIAAEAEVSIGALYTYYSGKDGVVGGLVLESLTALRHEVGASARGRAGLRDRLQAGIGSILSFYGAGARAAELLPVLVRGAGGGDGGEFASRVNGRLILALAPVAQAYHAAGAVQDQAEAKALGLASFVLGLVVFGASGRLDSLGVPADTIVAAFLAETTPP